MTPPAPLPPGPSERRARWARVVVAALFVALAAAMVRLAWLSDDAFITFRSVENLVHGHGPRWNVDDRVQTFTHPLWFWLLCALRLVTGELPSSTMWLGITLSLAAVGWLLRLCPSHGARIVLLAGLLSSRGWLDYTTSGLENPLAYVLVAALVAAHRVGLPRRRLFAVAAVTGALALVRLDLLLLGLPVLAAALRQVPFGAALRALAVGLAPLAAWSLFAAVYYGSPFPITAYAKAFAHGVPAGELLARGIGYLGAHLVEDPGMLAVIVLGTLAGACSRGHRALAVAVLLYLAYVAKVGGDYMLGRFLTPCATLAVVVLASVAAQRGRRVLFAALLLVVGAGLARGCPTYLRSIDQDLGLALARRADGLSDERTYYFAFSGMWSPRRLVFEPGFHSTAMRRAGDLRPRIDVVGSVGWAAWASGDLVHVVDPWLLDPLLMRLPVGDPDDWRIGHFYRRIPAGYLESVASGENRIEHPGLRRVYDAVRSATHEPIWSAPRWRHLWSLWTGGLHGDLAAFVAEQYRTPPRLALSVADFTAPLAPGTPWFRHAPARSCAGGGLAIRLPAPTAVAAVVLSLGGTADYRVELRHAGHPVHTLELRVEPPPMDGLQPRRVDVPPAVDAIDEIWVTSSAPVAVPQAAFLGRVELVRR